MANVYYMFLMLCVSGVKEFIYLKALTKRNRKIFQEEFASLTDVRRFAVPVWT